jgi:superfamily I DNA/RNA helicase
MKTEAAKERWSPVDVKDLEPAADKVVRGERTTLVHAGPGAGKTELLAQRACFLLQTGTCPGPRRILAISFKRDAARNLRERVAHRCGRELAARFDSYTFESFSKGLVDRFLTALPTWCRPAKDYRVLDKLNDKQAFSMVRAIPDVGSQLNDARRQGLNVAVLWRAFLGRPLPVDGEWVNASDEERAAADLWSFLTGAAVGSAIGFGMFGRMADLLLRTNPLILSALRKSYRVVFLDEFQDTTSIQYALVRTAFMESGAVLTAVGDDKQRIMGWAGAMRGVFGQFVKDFHAESVPLTRNYRSTEKLVAIQSVIATVLDADAVEAKSMVDSAGGIDECRVLAFDDDAAEATKLASMIRACIERDGLTPRDICILCRMKPPVYSGALRDALSSAGIRSRIENEMQDLLAEPLSECLLDFLKLARRERDPYAWGRSVALLAELGGDSSEEAMRRVVDLLLEYLVKLRISLAGKSSSEAEIEATLKNIMRFVGEDDFKVANPQYLQGDWYAQIMNGLVKALAEARDGRDWPGTLDEVEGVNSVPIMTTHKSKGLEYHTVIFVGLEDDAHFSFANNQNEETCGFFVAFSRAMKRVIFTFSGVRPTGRRGDRVGQERKTLKPLYDLFEAAGVEVENGDEAEI